VAFAALGLLRCRDRLEGILNAIAEPRQGAIRSAIAELDGVDEAGLKDALSETVRREDAALREGVAKLLGSAAAETPRAIWKWAARGARI